MIVSARFRGGLDIGTLAFLRSWGLSDELILELFDEDFDAEEPRITLEIADDIAIFDSAWFCSSAEPDKIAQKPLILTLLSVTDRGALWRVTAHTEQAPSGMAYVLIPYHAIQSLYLAPGDFPTVSPTPVLHV